MTKSAVNLCSRCYTGDIHIPHNKKNASQVFNSVLPYHSKSYQIFQKLVESAQAHVSFTGSYRISLKGHKGSITLEKLCNCVEGLLKNNPEFNEEERGIGILLTRSISNFEDICDRSLKNKNILTQMIAEIIHLFKTLFFYQSNTYWTNRIDCSYHHYTTTQFKIKTGKTPVEYYKNRLKDYRIGSLRSENPIRWILNEKKV